MKQSKDFHEKTKIELLREARFRCQACQSKSQITFHHKKKRSSHAEDLTVKENGCVLCQTCHMKADNPRTDAEKWEFSVFNTRKWQKVGELEREQLIWEHEQGIRDWGEFYDKPFGEEASI